MNNCILAIVGTLACQIVSPAQQIMKSGGTSNSTFMFGNTGYARKTQCIYPGSTLTNEVDGTIKKLYFKYGSTGNTSNQTLTDFKVRLQQTNDQSFSGTSFYTDLDTVLDSASYTIQGGTTGTWFSIPIDTTFLYEANRSLIVEVSFSATSIVNWGTYGTTNTPVRKLISVQVDDATGSGTSATWQDFGFDLTTVTGTAPQISFESGIQVFPNPTTHVLAVEMKDQDLSPGRFVIQNLEGKIILDGLLNSEQKEIDVRKLSAGAYLLEVYSGTRIFHRAFIKQ